MTVRIMHGDCLDILPMLAAGSVHAVITDPPYELGFMGKKWDATGVAFRPEVWTQVLRVMKPGAHLLAFGGTRTSHRMACAIEDAGFEIRDTLCWLYGSGFPKTRNHLKPAYEPIILARKPLAGTVAANTLQHGCGGLNIDACRVETTDGTARPVYAGSGNPENWRTGNKDCTTGGSPLGRWPANVAHDGSDEVEAAFAAFGERAAGRFPEEAGAFGGNGIYGKAKGVTQMERNLDTGTASRFFFSGKATADDRMDSKHPTVKPLALMAWLVKLVTPPGGIVLDPFSGSGTTLLAADRLQFHAIGIEQNAEYVADSERRLHIDKGLFANM